MADYKGNLSTSQAAGEARTTAAQGRNDQGTIGGVPDYTALMNAIQTMAKMQVELPQDVTAAIDTAALQQLGAQKSMQALHRGPVAQAVGAQTQDQVSQTAAGGNLKATRAAAGKASGINADVANQESQMNGQIGQKASMAEFSNRLRQFVLQGKAHHANMQIGNAAMGMGNQLPNANQSGIMSVQQAGNSALATADQMGIAGDMTQWGNTMAMVRGGLSALGSAASAYSGMDFSSPKPGTAAATSDMDNAPVVEPDWVDDQSGIVAQDGEFA